MADEFLQDNKEIGIQKYHKVANDRIIVKEYAPGVFRKIRKEYITEDDYFNSFKPCNNF